MASYRRRDCDTTRKGPQLGIFEGTLEDVLLYVCDLKDFWTWGYGGSVEKVEVKKISAEDSGRRRDLKAKSDKYRALLAEVENQLEAI